MLGFLSMPEVILSDLGEGQEVKGASLQHGGSLFQSTEFPTHYHAHWEIGASQTYNVRRLQQSHKVPDKAQVSKALEWKHL